MKRIIALMMAVLLFTVLTLSATAESVAEIEMGQMASVSMDETTFRTLSNSGTFSRSSYRSFNGEEVIHKNGYYYTYLGEMFGGVAVEAYDTLKKELQWVEEDTYQALFDTTAFNGLEYDGPAMERRWEEVSKQVLAAMWCYRYDNPLDCDLYSNRVYCTLSYYYSPETGKVTSATLVMFFYVHPAFESSMWLTQEEKIYDIAEAASWCDTAYEAIKYVHDYLARFASYDNEALSMNEDSERFFLAHSAFGVLNTKRGVCESYAKAFKEICDELPFPIVCTLMYSETHMWNAVRLNGFWYAVDVTWDDLDNSQVMRHDYFLCGDPDVVDGDSDAHTPNTDYTRVPNYEDKPFDPDDLATHACVPVTAAGKVATFYEEGYSMSTYCELCKKVLTPATPIPKETITANTAFVSNGVRITWNSVNGAYGYVVYRRIQSGNDFSEWEQLTKTRATMFTDTTVPFGTVCQYVVQPYVGTIYGDRFETEKISYLTAPVVITQHVSDGVCATWDAVDGADGYRVYRRVYNYGGWQGWKMLANTTALSYEDTTGESGLDCQYTVRAYRNIDGELYLGPYEASQIYYLKAPVLQSNNAEKGVLTTWDHPSSYVRCYFIYRRTYSDGKWSSWQKIKALCGDSFFLDETVISGGQYQYAVSSAFGSFEGAYREGNTIPYLATPTVKSANAVNGVSVNWNKIAGAASYRVYRRTYSGGKWSGWQTLGNVTATSYTDKTAVSGAQYQYTVRAQNGNEMSAYKAGATLRYLSTPIVKSANAAAGVSVSWNKIAGSTSYRVYRRTYSGGKWSGWQTVANTTVLSLTDKTAVSGTQYQYTVRAQNGNGMSVYKAGATIKRLVQPSVTVKKATKGFAASWKKVPGATGYRVYRRTYSGGKWSSWQTLKNTTALSYNDKTVKAGVKYQYTVRAYSGSQMSSYTASVTVKR